MTRPSPLPHGHTARRLAWQHLPPGLRAAVERRLGSPVVEAASRDSGYTPGFASVLTCADGTRHFVKAASVAAQRMFAGAYREEARTLAALPEGVPAARLQWLIDEDWVVLGLEHVDGAGPDRPWRADQLDRCLDALEVCADLLTPVPAGLEPDGAAEEFSGWPGFWDHVRGTRDLPHAEEAAALAERYAEVLAGDTLAHTDVRDDNVLLGERTVFCDWSFPVRGAAWVDTVLMLIGPRGDGLDADAVLAARRLTADVPDEHVDVLLSLLTGYFLKSADDPVPPTSPYLRAGQAWQGEVCWEWLAERRGWSA